MSLKFAAVLALSVTAFSAQSFADGGTIENLCQQKALTAAQAEIAKSLGATDAQMTGVHQSPWVITFSLYSAASVSNTNPAGEIDATVGFTNLKNGDCDLYPGVEVDEYSTNG